MTTDQSPNLNSNHIAAGLASAGNGHDGRGRARGRPGAGAQRERHGRALDQTALRGNRCDDAKAVVLVGGAKVGVHLVVGLDAVEFEVILGGQGGRAGHHGSIALANNPLSSLLLLLLLC